MIQRLLLGGQVAVVLLMYLFVWRVMRTARRDVAAPFGSVGTPRAGSGGPASGAALAEESTIIPATDVARARREAGIAEPRLVVAASGTLRAGVPFVLSQGGLTVGRAPDNDVCIDEQVVSGHHARFVAPDTLVDLDSTNGTLVNGQRVSGRVRLRTGDRIAIGGTEFVYEVPR